jgi:beta-xylosidase
VPYTLTAVGQPVSTSAIRDVSVVDNHLTVTWATVPGTSYEIATSTDLVNWTPVTTVQATSTQTTYADTATVSGPARFLRIRPL